MRIEKGGWIYQWCKCVTSLNIGSILNAVAVTFRYENIIPYLWTFKYFENIHMLTKNVSPSSICCNYFLNENFIQTITSTPIDTDPKLCYFEVFKCTIETHCQVSSLKCLWKGVWSVERCIAKRCCHVYTKIWKGFFILFETPWKSIPREPLKHISADSSYASSISHHLHHWYTLPILPLFTLIIRRPNCWNIL